MSYRRTRAMFVKELHHITRDARSLTMALAMPVMMLLLYGYALSLDVDHIRTGSTVRLNLRRTSGHGGLPCGYSHSMPR